VQRVSGVRYGELFFPQIAGVGLSYNPYVWSEHIDPEFGVMRLVFGLGTRAVDRHDDDYTRVVALGAPQRRPDSALDELRRYTQRQVDVIDLGANRLLSSDFENVAERGSGFPIEMFASRDTELERRMRERGQRDVFSWMLTFDKFLKESGFPKAFGKMLAILEEAYESPVDVEFAANFTSDESYRVNLVQCRPLQVSGLGGKVEIPEVPEERLVLKAKGAIIGPSRVQTVDRVVYVVPSAYAELKTQQKYAVARLVGKLTHYERAKKERHTLLIGPGRWGSTTPTLGVPVTFHEISAVAILVEVVTMRDGLVPDVSLGTHFFNDIVEADMLYTALFPGQEDNQLNTRLFDRAKALPEALAPPDRAVADAVRLVDLDDGEKLKFAADTPSQTAICHEV
jgi:hypothetical protein